MIANVQLIESKYNEFNAKYFSNELPHDLEFIIKDIKTPWGRANWNRVELEDGTYSIKPSSIWITSRFDMPEHVIDNVLLHEMVHILDYLKNPYFYISKNGKKYKNVDAHGVWFENTINDLNSRFGLSISKIVTKDEVNESKISNGSRGEKRAKKGYYIIFSEYADGDICLFTANEYKMNNFILSYRLFKSNQNLIKNLRVFKTHSLEFSNYTNSTERGIIISENRRGEILEQYTGEFEECFNSEKYQLEKSC